MSFTLPFYLSIVPILIAAIILLMANVFIRFSKVFGYVFAAIGFVILAAFGPSLFLDKVIIDETSVHQYTGFWFAPSREEIVYDGLEKIIISTEVDKKNNPFDVWRAKYLNGVELVIVPSNLWIKNKEAIRQELENKGIVITDETSMLESN